MDATILETIIAEETDAETTVAEATENAQKARVAADDTFRETFDKLSEGLTDEKKKSATEIKAAAHKFKDEIASSLRKDIDALDVGADKRVTRATSAVIERFKDYVGK